ncbi:MAG TPA: hypothetical protein VKB35_02115 [Ktedonobacteraceae bacterium]|nr:hypothetical protein [Ktedonobacteraceae bacterium]
MEDAGQTEAEDASSAIKTVLIVEDDQDLGLALAQVLQEETPYLLNVTDHPNLRILWRGVQQQS